MPVGGPDLNGDRLRVLLVGCGSMGSRHAAVVAADPGCELVALDLDPDRSRAVAEQFGATAVDRVPDEVDLAIVATPTTTHLEVAGPLLARGRWCLVEKPLADTVSAARQLAHPRCSVGHSERFNPAIRAAGALRPLRIQATRTAPPTARGLDVDVVLDLMTHDLDLVLGWSRGEVCALEARGDRDAVEVQLRTADGLVAGVVASRVADRKRRWIRCEEEEGAVDLDLLEGRAWRDGTEHARVDARDALTCQWAAFRDRVAAGRSDPDPGLRAVEVADRIRRALG